jgi:recombination protein RecR
MKYSSKILERAVEAFSSLPGIGKKNALRMALYLASKGVESTDEFGEAIQELGRELKQCKQCYNFSDKKVCDICSDPSRNKKLICAVESARDVMAIEDTQQFSGVYHVLEGVISPIDGVGPEDINLEELIDRIREEEVEEVIMAISSTIEGETTTYYLSRKLKEENVTISVIARGVSFGGDLEYADEITLGRSIMARQPYHKEQTEG